LAPGHDVKDEGDLVHEFNETPDPAAEKSKNFAENVIYNKRVNLLLLWIPRGQSPRAQVKPR
jgi:hypothetical protein